MNIKDVDKLIGLLQQVKAGKDIQWKDHEGNCRIYNCDPMNLAFSRPIDCYRIKPETKLRPWTPEEVPVGKVIRSKSSGNRFMILAVDEESIHISNGWYPITDLLKNFTLEDGSPCGVEVP